MEIRDSLQRLLNSRTFLLSKLTITKEKKHQDSLLNITLNINMKDMEYKKCYACEKTNTNFCWNCEKPHCDDHARAIFTYPLVNTLCLECAQELENLRIIVEAEQ